MDVLDFHLRAVYCTEALPSASCSGSGVRFPPPVLTPPTLSLLTHWELQEHAGQPASCGGDFLDLCPPARDRTGSDSSVSCHSVVGLINEAGCCRCVFFFVSSYFISGNTDRKLVNIFSHYVEQTVMFLFALAWYSVCFLCQCPYPLSFPALAHT